MNKFRLFVENFLIYGFGSIISKIIPFAMLPVITRLMPTTEYFGISDLSNTIISFSSAFAVMGMYDAMYRMFFEQEDEKYKKRVCSTALFFTLVTSVLVFIIMICLKTSIASLFFNDTHYAYIVYISAMATLVGATNSIIGAPTRMQNKRKVYLIVNTISPLLSYSISIPLLLRGFYTIALPLSGVISSITVEIIFGVLNHNWFNIRLFDYRLLRSMLVIAIPLLPNFLIYWVFNSCDKVMITNIIGLGAVGIYSAGAKLGHASQLIHSAFSGGWQFFAFSTMKESNQVQSTSLIFEYLGIVSYLLTAFVCALSQWLFSIIFPERYLEGYIISPYLFLAPLLLMLFQVCSTQFVIVKKTWPNMLILSIGAVSNIVINFLLIPIMGIEGAAVATLIGYVLSIVICTIILCKMKLLTISKRFISATCFTIAYFFLWRFIFANNSILAVCNAFVFSAIIFTIYKRDIVYLLQMIKRDIK